MPVFHIMFHFHGWENCSVLENLSERDGREGTYTIKNIYPLTWREI